MTDATITVHVPFRVRKRGGRKLMVSPDGTAEPARPQVDNSLVKALARAHRWKRLLEEGHHTSLTELARPRASTALTSAASSASPCSPQTWSRPSWKAGSPRG